MPQVNGDNLLYQQIVKRTIEALQAQDEAFAIEYETASDADLIAYVRQCVDVSYTPAPCEVVGGAYIAQRFGNWSAALKAAGLPSQYKPPREHHYPRYEQEYQQSLRQGMMGGGMSVADLVNHQSFILSLKQVVKQQAGHVNACEKAVDEVKKNWVQNKQRLNAFETLIERRATAQALVQSRYEQKLMDEFAQRAGQKRERL